MSVSFLAMYKSFVFAPLVAIVALAGCVSEEDSEMEFRSDGGFTTEPDYLFGKIDCDGPSVGGACDMPLFRVYGSGSSASMWLDDELETVVYERSDNSIYNSKDSLIRTIGTTFNSTQVKFGAYSSVDFNIRLGLVGEGHRVFDGSGTTVHLYNYDGRRLKRPNGQVVAEFDIPMSNIKDLAVAVYDVLLYDQ